MRTILSREIKAFSNLGQKGAVFGIALPELAAEKENIYVLTADLARLSGLQRFGSLYSEKLINVGIAEQNMIGIAAGLALEGNCVFATTYASFLTMRCYEQIRHNLGYQNANVKLIGSSSGLVMGVSGNTHYTYEDIGIMRMIPNIVIVSPADALEAYKMLWLLSEREEPAYLRLSGGLRNPIIYSEDYKLEIGKAIVLKEGRDLAILATGSMVYEAKEAAEKLEKEGISAKLINIHTLCPFDKEILEEILDFPLIVTVEEHRSIGGLYSIVCEYLAEKKEKPRCLSVAISQNYLKAGDYEFLKKQAGLDAVSIYGRIKEVLNRGKNGKL